MESSSSTSQICEALTGMGLPGEVILSAAAISSPPILLLSGIGPSKQLKNFSIPLMIALKGVGEGLEDNPYIALRLDSQPETQQTEPSQVVGIANDFKIIVQAQILPTSPNTTRMPIVAKMAFPVSKRKLELNNTDPRQKPSVKFNYLAKKKDLTECVKIRHLIEQVARSESITLFLGNQQKDTVMSSEDELRKFCKKNVRTCYHYHGGCAVGSVVDKDYRVNGIQWLPCQCLEGYQRVQMLNERRDVSVFRAQQKP